MPIDTRAKRQNVAQIGVPLPVSVLPSGTIDAAVRYQISWSYGGNITPPPPASGAFPDKTLIGYPFPDAYTQIGSIT